MIEHYGQTDDDRLILRDLSAGASGASPTTSEFAADVRRGLTDTHKHLPPKYFYDELGSQLFEAICLTPEYYVTRAEDEILERHADDIIRRAGVGGAGGEVAPLALLEMGSGSSLKTQRLIEAILRRQGELHYGSVDISAPALERAARVLLQSYRGLRVTAYAADYHTALGALKVEHPDTEAPASRNRTLALFLGSNIGNFTRAEAVTFVREMRAAMHVGDALLVGADLRKSREVLEAAYDDALGITAAFNLNLLVRINRELGADFNPRDFRHIARYDEAEGRVEAYLESKKDQTVAIPDLNLRVAFAAGERIHTENSYKYDTRELCTLAENSGFVCAETWLDEGRRFSSNLFRAA